MAGTIADPAPVKLDVHKDVGHAINLKQWIHDHKQDLKTHGKKAMFAAGEFKVYIYHSTAQNSEWHLHNGEVCVFPNYLRVHSKLN